jgi:hypothetical protein
VSDDCLKCSIQIKLVCLDTFFELQKCQMITKYVRLVTLNLLYARIHTDGYSHFNRHSGRMPW